MTEQSLTRRERQIMDLLFANPDLGVGEVNSHLADRSTYSSTRAALARLVEKGQLRFTRQGARYLYRPVARNASAGTKAVRRVVDTFFGGSPIATIDALLGYSSKKLSNAELGQLQDLLEAAKSNAQGEIGHD